MTKDYQEFWADPNKTRIKSNLDTDQVTVTTEPYLPLATKQKP